MNLDQVTAEDVSQWQPGETLLISGTMLTGRDAAHKKIRDLFDGERRSRRRRFNGKFIYYVGPVDPVRDEVGTGWANNINAHGWVHGHDARKDGSARDDR